MTNSSKGRLERRATAKAEAKLAKAVSYKPGDPAKAIITLTEVPGTGGFTVGLGLHGARMEELFPGKAHPISVVDVIALAATQMIKAQPEAFQSAVAMVNDTLRNVQAALENGEDPASVMGAANNALSGAVEDVEAAEEPEAANAG